MVALPGASTYFPGQPDPDTQKAKSAKFADDQRAEMIRNGVNPDDELVSVRIGEGASYLDPRTGCATAVLSESQYQRLEKQNADDARERWSRSAAEDDAAADRLKANGAETDKKIAALTAERDALPTTDDRRGMFSHRLADLETARGNMARDEAANRQAAKDARAAAKAVKVEPIYRPVVWYRQSEIDAENERRDESSAGVSPPPFPYRPAPGSDEAVGIKPRKR